MRSQAYVGIEYYLLVSENFIDSNVSSACQRALSEFLAHICYYTSSFAVLNSHSAVPVLRLPPKMPVRRWRFGPSAVLSSLVARWLTRQDYGINFDPSNSTPSCLRSPPCLLPRIATSAGDSTEQFLFSQPTTAFYAVDAEKSRSTMVMTMVIRSMC